MMTCRFSYPPILAASLTLLLAACSGKVASFEEFSEPVKNVEDRACDPGRFVTENEIQDEAREVRLSEHVLASNSEGGLALRSSVSSDEKDGPQQSFNDAFRRIMAGYVKKLEEAKGEGQRLRLLFYFNGGLNSQRDVEEQARRQIPCMLNDGFYPVFFVWDTSALDTYKEQATRIYDGHRTKEAWLSLLSPFRVGGDIFSGISKAPADYFIHSRRFLRAIQRTPPCFLIVQTEQIENVECPKEQHVNFVENYPPDGDSPIDGDRNVVIDMNRKKVDANQREVWRFIQYTGFWPVRLISTPLAHGLGEAAWQNMLRRTRTTVRRSIEHRLDRHGYKLTQGLDGDSQHTFHIGEASSCPNDLQEKREEFEQGTGVFARFFELLGRHIDKKPLPENKWICEDESERPIEAKDIDPKADEKDKIIAAALEDAEITLIGHSMGAIVINELVARFPTLPYSDIVVMAAAASVRDTRATLDQYFDQGTLNADETRFYSLMLHPLNDTRERQYEGAVPSGSLLMWIDEMYEVPRVPDDKTFGFWPNAKSSRNFFDDKTRERMLYRIFSRPDPAAYDLANPMEHGDFNNDVTCFWRPAFWGVRGTAWQKRYESMPPQALQECRAMFEPERNPADPF